MPTTIRPQISTLLTLTILLSTSLLAVPPASLQAQTTGKATPKKPDPKPTPAVQKLLMQAEQETLKYQRNTALKTLESALTLARKTRDRIGEADTLNYIGTIYAKTDNPFRALEFHQKALSLLQGIGDKYGEAVTLHNIGNAYLYTDNYSQALAFFQKALPRQQEVGNKSGEAKTLSSIGNIYARTNDLPHALVFLQKALPRQQEVGDKSGAAITLSNIGIVYAMTGNLSQALKFFQKALPLKQEVGDKKGEANILINIGNVHLNTNNPSQALASFRKALSLFQRVGDKYSEANTLNNIGLTHLALSQLPDAETALQSALIVRESLRKNLSSFSTDTKTAFQEEGTSIYLIYLHIQLLENKYLQAFQTLQQVRGRTLLERFQNGQVTLTGHLTEAERKEETALTVASNQATSQLLSTRDKADADKAKEALAKAESDLNTFYDALYAKYPDLATKRAVKIATFDEIAASLPDDTALVEFLTFNLEGINNEKPTADETVAFVVTRGAEGKPTLTVHHLPITTDELTEKVTDLREACADRSLRPYQSKAKELYQILLTPMEKELSGKKRLVICPDDALWDVPFAVLMDNNGKHLIETKEIALAYSGTAMKAALDARKTQKPATKTLLALANPDFGDETRFGRKAETVAIDRPITIPDRDVLPGAGSSMVRGGKLVPLPGTAKEAEAIVKDFGSQATVLTGKEAQEKTLKAKAGQYRYLHLATHGYFNDSAPFQSFVALAQPAKGDTENGLLTAREVFDLDLSSCEMTVLSACETGRGEKKVGEGVVGMSWALFAAGCPTQVVSSWKVSDDATAALMTRFYHDLTTGKSKGESLRQASLSLLANERFKHPYYWSPFNLIGDWE